MDLGWSLSLAKTQGERKGGKFRVRHLAKVQLAHLANKGCEKREFGKFEVYVDT